MQMLQQIRSIMIYITLARGPTNKQAQGLMFSNKVKVTTHPQVIFNNNARHEASTQKHLGIFLD